MRFFDAVIGTMLLVLPVALPPVSVPQLLMALAMVLFGVLLLRSAFSEGEHDAR